ncbi:antitermination protein [Rahnella sp. BCC 1045]|uniref:antitermination protein Q n=1 Tax=Rahnella sp. BCC 1045 TaxID=2816251 RepID=UPI001C259D4D|nr:antitermination protein [Rahnella sp. BCC 1045]MBU9819944.1 antitermination protein [Rahnella sp. BCC 1045]
MKLENALKQFNPKTQTFTNVPPATASDSLTGPDLAACLGMAESQASFGMGAFLGKNGISKEDGQRTIERLSVYAMKNAGKHVGKAAGRRMAHCMVILAKMAYAEYCKSAGSVSTCNDCAGAGFLMVKREVVKYAGYVGADGEMKIPEVSETQTVKELCQTCNGKGTISHRCRCNGTGRVRDLEKSNLLGIPVDKTCDRCAGRGFKRTPGTTAYKAIVALLPDLQERTWNRNWRPLYESLVTKCEQEESHADAIFQRITSR